MVKHKFDVTVHGVTSRQELGDREALAYRWMLAIVWASFCRCLSPCHSMNVHVWLFTSTTQPKPIAQMWDWKGKIEIGDMCSDMYPFQRGCVSMNVCVRVHMHVVMQYALFLLYIYSIATLICSKPTWRCAKCVADFVLWNVPILLLPAHVFTVWMYREWNSPT